MGPLRLALTGFAALLAACSSCGKLAGDDAGVEADAAALLDGAKDAISSADQETCSVVGGDIVDSGAGTQKTLTCPVGWHCDFSSGVTPAGVCCPAGHTDHPKGDPACAYCSCPNGPNKCCPAGFSCASWDAAPPICDGG